MRQGRCRQRNAAGKGAFACGHCQREKPWKELSKEQAWEQLQGWEIGKPMRREMEQGVDL